MNYLVTDKLFPFDSDGGTAFTAYEWATELHSDFDGCVVLYHGKNFIDPTRVPFDIINAKSLNGKYKILCKVCKSDKIFLNSAFKSFEIFHFFLTLICGANLFWLCHGSLDFIICKGVKKKVYVQVWARLLGIIIKSYISNSQGEHDRLPSFIRAKSIVIENLFPFFTLALESSSTEVLSKSEALTFDENYVLIFGRIDPKKKIVETIERLYEIGFFSENRLKIIGVETTPAYVTDIQHVIEKLKVSQSCELKVSLISGQEKVELLRNASNLILFSDSEGLPIVILEAITLGTKVICSPGCNVENLVPLVTVVELDRLCLEYFSNYGSSDNNLNIRSLDSGREKLKLFFDGSSF